MIRIASKPCPRCDGTGAAQNDTDRVRDGRCVKCKGSGRLPGRVRRILDDPTHERPIVIEVRAEGVYVREQGRRTTYGPLTPYGLLAAGARLYVRARDAERAARRKAKAPKRKSSRSITRGR